jgi:hypothetical protein
VPNGEDKNICRLEVCCAAYREKYGEWPAEARLAPMLLHDIARYLDSESFEALASRIRLRTRDLPGLSVGGSKGVMEYGPGPSDEHYLDLARRWLDVPRH